MFGFLSAHLAHVFEDEYAALPLTALRCVDLIVTDFAVVAVTPDGLVLREVAEVGHDPRRKSR